MPKFLVTVRYQDAALEVARQVRSQNVAHAAATGLSLVGGRWADAIEVVALAPVPGRPSSVLFEGCSQGVYGFCYTSRSFGERTKERSDS